MLKQYSERGRWMGLTGHARQPPWRDERGDDGASMMACVTSDNTGTVLADGTLRLREDEDVVGYAWNKAPDIQAIIMGCRRINSLLVSWDVEAVTLTSPRSGDELACV